MCVCVHLYIIVHVPRLQHVLYLPPQRQYRNERSYPRPHSLHACIRVCRRYGTGDPGVGRVRGIRLIAWPAMCTPFVHITTYCDLFSLAVVVVVVPLVHHPFHACNNAYSMHLHVRTCTDMPCSVVFTAYLQVEGLFMESSMRCGQPFARHIRLCLYRCFGARGPVADNAWRVHGCASYLAFLCICQEM